MDGRGTRWGEAKLDGSKVLRWSLLHAGSLVGGALCFSWSAVAVFAVLTAVTMCLGVSVGMHRGLIHRAFRAPLAVERTLALVGALAGLGGIIGMSRMHHLRDFHQNQPEPDCPPYFGYRDGFACSMAYALFHTWHPRDAAVYPPVEPRVLEDPFFRFLERAGLWLQVPLAVALYALGGAAWVAWGVLVRLALTQDGFWSVHYVSHVEGEQPYELPGCAEQGRNAGWLALVSMGESWHNNHHAYPGSAQMGQGWRQPDPGWWAVRALAALGLVFDVKAIADLPLRPGARARSGRQPPRAPSRRPAPRWPALPAGVTAPTRACRSEGPAQGQGDTLIHVPGAVPARRLAPGQTRLGRRRVVGGRPNALVPRLDSRAELDREPLSHDGAVPDERGASDTPAARFRLDGPRRLGTATIVEALPPPGEFELR